jgi:hypothetical protein
MSTTTEPILLATDYKQAEHKLGDMVMSIEFTLISVIAGLMLVPLIDYATPLIHELNFEYWLYIVIQLVAVMFFWTALIAHALTFVGWPIDIGHNLLYILVFPLIGIQNHFISDPRAFYPMLFATTLVSELLVAYDLALIRRRRIGAQGAAAELYATAYRRQVRLMYQTPGSLLIMLLMSVLVWAFPDFFVAQHMHVVLALVAGASLSFVLGREIQDLSGMRGKILNTTSEQFAAERGDAPV